MWFVMTRGEQAGPFSEQILRLLLQQGQIGQDATVWRDGMPEWVPIGRIIPPAVRVRIDSAGGCGAGKYNGTILQPPRYIGSPSFWCLCVFVAWTLIFGIWWASAAPGLVAVHDAQAISDPRGADLGLVGASGCLFFGWAIVGVPSGIAALAMGRRV